MGRPYRAKTIAYYFLELGERDNVSISPMKLQKLIYFAHGWCLAITGEPLIEESVDAWMYGPVVADVYYEFKEFGAETIQGKKPDKIIQERLEALKKDKQTVQLIDKVWEIYGHYDAFKLSQMTHLPNTPWLKARSKTPEKLNVTIDDDSIREYFINTVQKNR